MIFFLVQVLYPITTFTPLVQLPHGLKQSSTRQLYSNCGTGHSQQLSIQQLPPLELFLVISRTHSIPSRGKQLLVEVFPRFFAPQPNTSTIVLLLNSLQQIPHTLNIQVSTQPYSHTGSTEKLIQILARARRVDQMSMLRGNTSTSPHPWLRADDGNYWWLVLREPLAFRQEKKMWLCNLTRQFKALKKWSAIF